MAKCPCCGYDTLRESGAFEVCYLCKWEDTVQDDGDADGVRGFNGDYSLAEARMNYTEYGIMLRQDDPRFAELQTPGEVEAKRRIVFVFQSLENVVEEDERSRLEGILQLEKEVLFGIAKERVEKHNSRKTKQRFSRLLRCRCCGYPTLEGSGFSEVCYMCRWRAGDADVHDHIGRRYIIDEARENFWKHLTIYDPSYAFYRQDPDQIQAKKRVISAFLDMKTASPGERLELIELINENARILQSQ